MKNKGADQPHGNYAAYQLLCLFYIDSTMSVLQKTNFPASCHLENQSVNTRVGVICLCYIYSTMSVLQKTKFPVWPNFFLMHVFYALKGPKLIIIISCQLENQSVNTRAGGGGGGNSKLAFDIINEHLYTPCMLRIFQTVKLLIIFTLMAILDSMHITPLNNSRLYLNLHNFIIKEYY